MHFPWYDSQWHANYQAVAELLAETHPDTLSEFINTLAPLTTTRSVQTQVIEGVIDQATLTEANEVVRQIPIADWEVHELAQFGRLVIHDHPYFTDLQNQLVDTVSQYASEPVVPRYNFLAIYNNRGICEPHMDEPQAKWTLDISLDRSDSWPIQISDVTDWPVSADFSENWQTQIRENNQFGSFECEPGGALLFSGSSQWHYRDPAPGHRDFFYHLIFMHYVPESMQVLVDPRTWATQFRIPEIGRVISYDND